MSYLGDGERRRPLVLQNIKADTSVGVNVAVIYFGSEGHLGGLERVVRREVDIHEEHTARVWGLIRAHDSGLPVEQIIAHRSTRAVSWGVLSDLIEFFLNPLQSHDVTTGT